jgi:hypothetical protein
MKTLSILLLFAFLLPGPRDPNCYDWYGGKACMPTAETFFTTPPPVTTGAAVFYNPGAMWATAIYRGYSPQIDGILGEVAAETPAMIGWVVWLKREGLPWEGPYLVVDCPRRNYQYGQVVNWGQVVEVDFETAERWGMVKVTGLDDKHYYTFDVIHSSIPVTMTYYPPDGYLPKPVVYADWYKSIFKSGPVKERILENVPDLPTLWCITNENSCNGKWQHFAQPESPLPVIDRVFNERFQ